MQRRRVGADLRTATWSCPPHQTSDNPTRFLETAVTGAVKKLSGRDTLLRVRNRNRKMDPEHRVRTRSDPRDQRDYSQLPFSLVNEGSETANGPSRGESLYLLRDLCRSSNVLAFASHGGVTQIFPAGFSQSLQPLHDFWMLGRNIRRFSDILLQIEKLQTNFLVVYLPGLAAPPAGSGLV